MCRWRPEAITTVDDKQLGVGMCVHANLLLHVYVVLDISHSGVAAKICLHAKCVFLQNGNNTWIFLPVDASKKYTLQIHTHTQTHRMEYVQQNPINSGKSIGVIRTFNDFSPRRPISVKK